MGLQSSIIESHHPLISVESCVTSQVEDEKNETYSTREGKKACQIPKSKRRCEAKRKFSRIKALDPCKAHATKGIYTTCAQNF